jgi:ankyrin repeat protein
MSESSNAMSAQHPFTSMGDVSALEDLVNGVRYSIKSQVVSVLDRAPHLVNMADGQGNSSAHWAAKRGDLEILRLLGERGADFTTETLGDAKMMPIHWAASDGKIGALRFLLSERGVDINAQDGNRCTAVIIAAQHDQAAAVAFLVKNGADMGICDKNGDTALHWAAYKGLVEIVGLLAYSCPQTLEKDDVFGQTPLHLAALRCHEEVIEYLVSDCGADLTKQDKNGLTALDLSVKKSPLEMRQLRCEWVIRRLTARNNILEAIQGYARHRFKDPRLLTILAFGIHEREWAQWPWRVVFISNVVGSLVVFQFAVSETLDDLYLLHLMNTICATVFWLCFALLLQKNTAVVRSDDASNTVYDRALSAIGNAGGENGLPSLCHTCHVLKPLRSKHCKFQRRCTNKFDHFCPFVYNTVSRDNYKFFYGLLVAQFVGSIFFEITCGYLVRRVTISWSMTFFILYHFFWLLMIIGLLQYHTMLITQNLTTNEHIGMGKYAYLRNEYGSVDNPFSKGSAWANVLDAISPSTQVYYSRAEVIRDRESERSRGDESSSPLLPV